MNLIFLIAVMAICLITIAGLFFFYTKNKLEQSDRTTKAISTAGRNIMSAVAGLAPKNMSANDILLNTDFVSKVPLSMLINAGEFQKKLVEDLSAERVNIQDNENTWLVYTTTDTGEYPVRVDVKFVGAGVCQVTICTPNIECDDQCRIDVFSKISSIATLCRMERVKSEPSSSPLKGWFSVAYVGPDGSPKKDMFEMPSMWTPNVFDASQPMIPLKIGSEVKSFSLSKVADYMADCLNKGKSVAIHGPSGAGKTHFAQRLAAQADRQLVMVSNEILNNFEKYYKWADSLAKSEKVIFFVDEIQDLNSEAQVNLIKFMTSPIVELNRVPFILAGLSFNGVNKTLLSKHRVGFSIELTKLSTTQALTFASKLAEATGQQPDLAGIQKLAAVNSGLLTVAEVMSLNVV